jgi:hypothetical protein
MRASIAGALMVGAFACATRKSGGELSMLAGVDWHLVEVRGQPAVPADVAKRPWLDSALTHQEDQFLSALNTVDRAKITGDTLVLSKGSERLATVMR